MLHRTGRFLRRTAAAGAAGGILLFSACQTSPPAPSAALNDPPSLFFHAPDRGFSVNVREPSVRYHLVLERIDEPPRPALHLTVLYANPLDPYEPLREKGVFAHDQSYLFLESPPVEGLRENAVYTIRIEARLAEEDPEPLETWQLTITSPLEMKP